MPCSLSLLPAGEFLRYSDLFSAVMTEMPVYLLYRAIYEPEEHKVPRDLDLDPWPTYYRIWKSCGKLFFTYDEISWFL